MSEKKKRDCICRDKKVYCKVGKEYVPVGVNCNPYFWRNYQSMMKRWGAIRKRHFAHHDHHGPGHLVKRK